MKNAILAALMLLCAQAAIGQAKPEAPVRLTTPVTLPEGKSVYTVLELPASAGEDIIGGIIAGQKGKPVLVDFWATWCGPCIAAISSIHSVKPEIIEKGVVMIYITGETSPKRKWEQDIQHIGSNHYYLTKDQWMSVCQKHNIKSIPHYMIFDKEGNMSFQTTGYPGNEKVLEELSKVW